MGGLPSGVRVDIEFTAGTWTNVTSAVDAAAGISIKYGRTSAGGDPQVATCSLRLENFDGAFTPKNASSAYYPNFVPRKRIRVSYNSGTTPRYTGYIKQILPTQDGGLPYVTISATDRTEQLSTVADLLVEPSSAVLATSPVFFFPLSDAAGSWPRTLVDLTGNSTNPWGIYTAIGAIAGPTLGDSGIVPVGEAMAMSGTPSAGLDLSVSQYLPIGLNGTTQSAACWAYVAAAPSGLSSGLDIFLGGLAFNIATTPGASTLDISVTTASTPGPSATIAAGLHHYAATLSITAGTLTLIFYVDGVNAGSYSGALATATGFGNIIDMFTTSASPKKSQVAHLAGWSRVLSPTEVATIYSAGYGYPGELPGARIARYLGMAGLSPSDYNLATGTEALGSYPISGKTALQASRDTSATEDGGSALFVDVDGRVRFNDRTTRNVGTPAITFDAQADLDGSTWAPSFDALGVIDQSTATRNGGGSVTVTDGSTTPATTSTTFYSLTDESLLSHAQYDLWSTSSQLRLPQVAVDLIHAQNSATLYTALGSVTIGSLARITNIPNTVIDGAGSTKLVFPYTQIDGYVEGWSEDIRIDSYRVVFDLSPALPRFLLETGTLGRLVETAGSMTLNGSITGSATSISVATSGGNPTFSTTAGDYSPTALLIKIDEEILAVTAAPASSVTPQTLTVTRGALGTFANAHSTGASVSVYTGALVL